MRAAPILSTTLLAVATWAPQAAAQAPVAPISAQSPGGAIEEGPAAVVTPLAPLPAGLAEESVEVKINYSGARIVLFAASPLAEDATTGLAVALIGPQAPVTVVRRRDGAADRFRFISAPVVFVTGAEPQVADTTSPEALAQAGLDPAPLALPPRETADDPQLAAWRSALIALKAQQSAYLPEGAAIERLEGGLRRARMRLPPNSPPGEYIVRAVLFQNGKPIGSAERPLQLVRGGMDATMFNLASRHSFIYGLVAVALGLAVGALAAVIGRR